MASAGPNSAATIVDDAGIGDTAWTNPGNAVSSNDTYAVCTFTSIGGISHYLNAQDFGFSLPAGVTIDGIVVEVEKKKGSGAPTINDTRIRIIKGGAIGSTDKSGAAWSETEAYVTYGGAADLWGETWADTDIEATNFGFAMSATGGLGGAGYNISVDHIRITVYYTEAATQAKRSMQQFRQRVN